MVKKCEICSSKEVTIKYHLFDSKNINIDESDDISTCDKCWVIVFNNDYYFPNYLPKEQRKRYLLKKITKL